MLAIFDARVRSPYTKLIVWDFQPLKKHVPFIARASNASRTHGYFLKKPNAQLVRFTLQGMVSSAFSKP
ncbi:MAG: hypothetical protein ETSY2_44470 [Candidatus Entotheonella gemina]|uniref:Uncharacterized protein n=1 Tax=Candidatus Entotheonella gemina TaxID=1429439 RepID=W4LIH5_9BACT|nr:MAG: hypothetical protein ETSY2_44470 [Candidatus Entotheonella gemina]